VRLGKTVTCVVHGDTVWFRGTKYRFKEIDTPEKAVTVHSVRIDRELVTGRGFRPRALLLQQLDVAVNELSMC
jgi:hypothetical protein